LRRDRGFPRSIRDGQNSSRRGEAGGETGRGGTGCFEKKPEEAGVVNNGRDRFTPAPFAQGGLLRFSCPSNKKKQRGSKPVWFNFGNAVFIPLFNTRIEGNVEKLGPALATCCAGLIAVRAPYGARGTVLDGENNREANRGIGNLLPQSTRERRDRPTSKQTLFPARNMRTRPTPQPDF